MLFFFQMAAKMGHIKAESSVFFLCDVQEKFQPAIIYFDNLVQSCCKLVSDMSPYVSVLMFVQSKILNDKECM